MRRWNYLFASGYRKMELNLGQRILVKLAECTIIGFLENHQLFGEKNSYTDYLDGTKVRQLTYRKALI